MTNEIPEFPEPTSYSNRVGWVKKNPLNNPSYLAQAVEMLPEMSEALVELDKQIEAIAPGYNISQIKVKFGELRYYYALPEETSAEVAHQVRELVSAVEGTSYALLK